MKPDAASFVAVASAAVVSAGDAIEPFFGLPAGKLHTEFKGDDTPVTNADRLSERIISESILSAFEDIALVREEENYTGGLNRCSRPRYSWT